MKVFISGGCKNGKSSYAERIARNMGRDTLYYIATMRPVDEEDDMRIARHQNERAGAGFITIEQAEDITAILEKCDTNAGFLLDSTTALLANEMFLENGQVVHRAHETVITGLSQVLENVAHIVMVSDYIFSDAEIYDPLTEAYRKSLAAVDRALAEASDVVIEVTFAGLVFHKGEALFRAGGLL